MNLNELSIILRAIGDPSRLRILCLIFEHGELCVSDIALKMEQSIAITSHHLRALSERGLLASTRKGKQQCYAVTKNTLTSDIKKFICKYKN